jgi:hypothetical protein
MLVLRYLCSSPSIMEPIPTPTITVSFVVDLKLKYDPFKGKSPMQFAASIEDDLRDVLMDWRPEILNAYTSITEVNEDNV